MAFFDQQKFLGGMAGFLGQGLDFGALATTADLTLDVNGATGSDVTGDGSPGKPFATIGKAFSVIPIVRRHIITIRLFTGTYAETVHDGGIYVDNGLFTGKLNIVGQNFTTPTLGSGSITTGTLGNAPATGCTRTVAGAAWNTNELKGMMAQITSGALNGQYFPIAANVAGSLDIPNTSASLNGATFNIVVPACIITNGPGQLASVVGQNAAGNFAGNGLVVQRVKLQSSSFYGLYAASGACQLIECVVNGQTFAGILQANFNTQVSFSRSYIQNLSGQVGISAAEVSDLSVGGSVIDGGAFGIQATDVMRFVFNASGHLVVQNATTAGLDFRAGPLLSDSFSTQKPILRNNAIGMRLQGSGHFLMQLWEIVNNTSHGIQMNAANQYTTCHNSLNAFACKIQNNGGDGIRIETSHNHVQFSGAGSDISGNTGYGLRVGGQPAGYAVASHNSVMFDSNVTMSSNTAGDVTHDDGTTTKTIAQVRSDGAEISASLFNRVAAV